jgi:hypothetical protein
MRVQIVTANRLVDGVVVYFTAEQSWSEVFAESAPFRDDASAAAALAGVDSFVKARIVVGPYLAEVEETPEGLEPASARERIRASHTPTITPDVGSWTGRISG